MEEMKDIRKFKKSSTLHEEYKTFDKNNNGCIEVEEYAEYLKTYVYTKP